MGFAASESPLRIITSQFQLLLGVTIARRYYTLIRFADDDAYAGDDCNAGHYDIHARKRKLDECLQRVDNQPYAEQYQAKPGDSSHCAHLLRVFIPGRVRRATRVLYSNIC
jgi:hypothetical protein